jgi:glycosyltransferase involved in cell wall biosynthesis
MPSRSEGTPLALVEAMICGRPSVVTDVGGNLEWVEEPRNGFIAEAPTVRSFGKALERAWMARDRWPSLGAAAREDALRRLEESRGELLDLITAAAARPGSNADGGPLEAVASRGRSAVRP